MSRKRQVASHFDVILYKCPLKKREVLKRKMVTKQNEAFIATVEKSSQKGKQISNRQLNF